MRYLIVSTGKLATRMRLLKGRRTGCISDTNRGSKD
jgi:hypothetical protein